MDRRLQALADFVQEGSVAADIGTDHGHLALALVQQGRAERVIASDKNRGPYEAACRSIQEAGLEQSVEVRLGDGLQVLQPGEADTICIAGMGGQLICEILSASPEVLLEARQLILQPMNAAKELRGWLYGHGWNIEDESLAEADGRPYEIISAVHGQAALPSPVLLSIGPRLWEKKPQLLKRHVAELTAKLEKAVQGMEKSRAATASAKYRSLKQQLKELEGYMKW